MGCYEVRVMFGRKLPSPKDIVNQSRFFFGGSIPRKAAFGILSDMQPAGYHQYADICGRVLKSGTSRRIDHQGTKAQRSGYKKGVSK